MRVKGHFTRSLGTPDWVVEHLGGIRIYGEDKLAISRLPTQKRFQPQINIRHADRKRGGGGGCSPSGDPSALHGVQYHSSASSSPGGSFPPCRMRGVALPYLDPPGAILP